MNQALLDRQSNEAGAGCIVVICMFVGLILLLFYTVTECNNEYTKQLKEQEIFVKEFGTGKIIQIYTTREGGKIVYYPVRVVLENSSGMRLILDSNGSPVVEGDLWTIKLDDKEPLYSGNKPHYVLDRRKNGQN